MYTIYSAPWCGYCQKAKDFLHRKGEEHEEVVIEGMPKETVEKLIGFLPKTIPQIFYNGTHIGGYTDLVELFKK